MARLSAAMSKPGRAGIEDDLIAPDDEVDGGGQVARDGRRHDDGAVAVGVDEVAVAHAHAVDVDRAAEIDDVDPGVARPDFAGEQLEARRQHVEVADRAVGDAAQ